MSLDKKILLVINPKAGKRKGLRDREELESIIKSFSYDCITYFTNGKDDIINIRKIKEEQEVSKVIVCGGDGTLNMVVTSLYLYVDELVFIFLPYGSINIFALENNYPKNPKDALRKILSSGNIIRVVPGIVNNSKIFLLMTSVGFDSHLVYKVQTSKNKYMFFNYIFRFFTEVFRYDFKKKFTLNVGENSYKGSFIIVSNIKSYAGFLKLTPEALLYDKHFDILILNSNSFFSILVFIIKTLFSFNSENVIRLKSNEVFIDGDFVSEIDGEIGEKLPIYIRKGKEILFEVP